MNMDFARIAALVERSRAGDAEARSELCRQTYDMAYYTALKLLRNPEDALDVVQDAYLRAFANLDRLADTKSFVRWLSQIVGNAAKDSLKRKRPALFAELQPEAEGEPEFLDDRENLTPQGSLEDAETRRLVAAMVEELPEEQRLCVLMYYYNELSVAEIAAALGVSENTVKSRLNYARRKIKEAVLELERTQGVKLYGLAPIPLLVWALRSQAAATALPAAASGQLLAAVGGQAAALTAAAQGAAQAASAAPAAAGSAAAQAASAARTAAGAGAKAVSAKLVAGIAAGVVALAGVGFGIYQATRPAPDPLEQLQAQILEELDQWGSATRDLLGDSGPAQGTQREAEEPPEPVEIDPLAWLEVEFEGVSGMGSYQVSLEDPDDLVKVEVENKQGALRNGDTLQLSFTLRGETAARHREDYLLTTRSHGVTVSGLLEPALSLEGVDHAALDAAMLALCDAKVQERYPAVGANAGSLTYQTGLQRRTGFYGINPDNPADNIYITCYDMSYTRSSGGGGMVFMFVWAKGCYLEDGVLYPLDPDGLLWNQIAVYKDGASYNQEEALAHVQISADMSSGKYQPEPVEPQ